MRSKRIACRRRYTQSIYHTNKRGKEKAGAHRLYDASSFLAAYVKASTHEMDSAKPFFIAVNVADEISPTFGFGILIVALNHPTAGYPCSRFYEFSELPTGGASSTSHPTLHDLEGILSRNPTNASVPSVLEANVLVKKVSESPAVSHLNSSNRQRIKATVGVTLNFHSRVKAKKRYTLL